MQTFQYPFPERVHGFQFRYVRLWLPDGEVRQAINDALIAHDLVLDDFDIHATSKGETSILKMRYSGHREDQKKFVLSLWGTRGVREVRQI